MQAGKGLGFGKVCRKVADMDSLKIPIQLNDLCGLLPVEAPVLMMLNQKRKFLNPKWR